MFTVAVSDSVMIAHSFQGEIFGPAQRLHGATYVVEVEMERPALSPEGLVADIGRASDLLKEILGIIAYRNLDDIPEFSGINTTTEYLAFWVFQRYRDALKAGRLEGDAAKAVTGIIVTLREKPDAWARYRGPVA